MNKIGPMRLFCRFGIRTRTILESIKEGGSSSVYQADGMLACPRAASERQLVGFRVVVEPQKKTMKDK